MRLQKFYERSEGLEPYISMGPVSIRDLSYRMIRLDANENLFLPLEFMREILMEESSDLDPRFYPRGDEKLFKGLLSEKLCVDEAQLIVGSGGDHIIDLVTSSLLREGEEVVAVTPTFSMYERTVRAKRIAYSSVEIGSDFQLDPDRVLDSISSKTGLVVICSPNNPTGKQFKREGVLEIVEGFDGPVLLDEAYAEFGDYSLVGEAGERDNLLVLRTLSKAFGLAGMRLGYAVTNVKMATVMNERYLMPYPVSSIALKVARRIIGADKVVEEAIKRVKSQRARLIMALQSIGGVTAFHSSTNFVLFDTIKPYTSIHGALRDQGILVRKIGKVPGYHNCLRVTVAPQEQMKAFIVALREALK